MRVGGGGGEEEEANRTRRVVVVVVRYGHTLRSPGTGEGSGQRSPDAQGKDRRASTRRQRLFCHRPSSTSIRRIVQPTPVRQSGRKRAQRHCTPQHTLSPTMAPDMRGLTQCESFNSLTLRPRPL